MRKIYKPKKEKPYTICETIQAILSVIIGAVLILMIALAIKMPSKATNKQGKTKNIQPQTTSEAFIPETEEVTNDNKNASYKQYLSRLPLAESQVEYIVNKAEEKGVEPALVFALIEVESGFDTKAENGSCYGLMQVNANNYDNPEMARNSLDNFSLNVDAGIEILSKYLKKYPVEKALTCYNYGESGAKNKASSGYAKKVLHAKEKYE